MTRPEDFIGKPVFSLQEMLREISFAFEGLPRVYPDGNYSESTRDAVIAFQRRFGLPTTGVADLDTWESIVGRYKESLFINSPPRPLYVMHEADVAIIPGGSHYSLYPAQAVFTALSEIFDDLEPVAVTGIHSGDSEAAVRWLQRISAVEETGIYDKLVWDRLSRLYDLHFGIEEKPGTVLLSDGELI